MRTVLIAMLFFLGLISHTHTSATACTSFCMDTFDGPIFGTNCDLFIPGDGLVFVNRRGIAKEGYFENVNGDVAAWVSKYGSVTFNLAGRELVWGGINEAGLVMSTMQLNASECPKPDERFPLGAGYLVQYVLDTSSTIQEALVALEPVRPPESECDNHFLIVDAEGMCAAIEYLDGELVIFTGEDLPVKAMANMRYERSATAYERGGPRWWWSNPGASAQRVAGAVNRSKDYDASRDTSAVAYAFETLTHVVADHHTKWNIVFDITQRRAWYRSARSPSMKDFSLDAFDFSCDAPMLMLDMNAPLEGNVVKSFVPYDHDVNKELFQVFCARWGIDVSEERAIELMDLFENFDCAP